MRPAAQQKGGFYPAPTEAIDAWLKHVRLGKSRSRVSPRHFIIDPCCGQGDAIQHIASRLGIPSSDTYGIELEKNRAKRTQAEYPDMNLLWSSHNSVSFQGNPFGLVWLNPPFDGEFGSSNRVETAFLRHWTARLKEGQIMALVIPESVVGNSDLRQLLKSWYDDLWIMGFPESCRKFQEVIITGRKRKESISAWKTSDRTISSEPVRTVIPATTGGVRGWKRTQLNEEELNSFIARSPLMGKLKSAEAVCIPRPPLALGKGHIALLLASGHLDGVVCPPGEQPHVVRGTARKVSYVKEVEASEEKTQTVSSERIDLIVRTVDSSGTIRTFQEEGGNDERS